MKQARGRKLGQKLASAALMALLAPQLAMADPVGVSNTRDGDLLPVRVDADAGKILITLPKADAEGVMGRFIYATAIRSGLGSAPIRIDRGMLGPTQILAFRRFGRKVAVVYENPRFRATGEASVQYGAKTSFPFSTIAMLDIVSSDAKGTVVDISPFLTRDTMHLADALNQEAKGFRLADNLSAADPTSVKVFPDNIEMEAVQTFTSDTPGREVGNIAADPRQISFTIRHSLIRLPGPGFALRKFDIRSGSHGTQVYDFGTPLGDDVQYQLANHFRLDKVDPTAAKSRVKKPITFYIDNAAPEPIRGALARGVAWWNQAFESAGYIDAFQVKPLTPDIDPQDARYSIVNWGDRLTRSWSYGGGIIDPRTGEIIKGNVVLGALRVRQDMQIFEALVGAAQDNTGGPNDPVKVSLDRISQLGAHEVGHAIGFVHNFAGSTQGRTSVMDYPGPLIGLKGGKIDLSDAYAKGIGSWDKFTVQWLYGQPKPGTDADKWAFALADAEFAKGTRYMTDIDGRADDGPAPHDSMWDNGEDKPAELAHMLAVRRVALNNFGPGVLRKGEALSNLRRKFVPVWLLARYEVAATGKWVGGVDYAYAVAGDANKPAQPVAAAKQRAALAAMLKTLSPAELTVPDALLGWLSSGVNGRNDAQFDTEVFDNAGAAAFDPLVATDVAAQVTLDSLLAPTRLTRVHLQQARDPGQLGLAEMIDALGTATWEHNATPVERRIALRALLSVARARRDAATPVDVAALLQEKLDMAAAKLGEGSSWGKTVAALLKNGPALEAEIGKMGRKAPAIPPGMPIGGDTGWFDN
ncbi:zinc-dependent metalloprotease [Novosphingobium humi]|uniref:Zinc-dependent metalloprotease n=1 Tax=Novosphingobium humi TaxID=2282397 RepID=A0ABY7U0L0_9SPHN|nr:zinc-dependent metalloprotease [Novosphingobium humi]WCT77864.1 zinc-dependent metalloprotease [Novosphingobium humi]